MTLNNAHRRFNYLGYVVERDVPPYRYKIRRAGGMKWIRGNSLELLLRAACDETGKDFQEMMSAVLVN